MKKMMALTYRLMTLWGCLMMLSLGSCVKNEFKVDFEFPKDHIGNYLMTYYARDKRGGRWIEHTASIQEGKAIADGITRLPTLVYITDASSPGNRIMLYVERGDEIRIAGEGRDMASWTVTGNKLSERWSQWRREAYPKKNDREAFRKSIEDYVKMNPKDELSALLLLTEWNRREDPEGFIRLWNSIDEGARGHQLVETCGVTDLMGNGFVTGPDGKLRYAKDPALKRLVLRSRDNGVDTIEFNKPSIIYFYDENNAARREAADSLKLLGRAYPDSSKRVIADIYMDSDSMTWINAIRRDSLKGAVRGWQPRSVAGEDMAGMGVVRLPWFVVKDRAAKETYAGDDLKEAVAAFRKIAGKPDSKAVKGEAKNEELKKPEASSRQESKDKPRILPPGQDKPRKMPERHRKKS